MSARPVLTFRWAAGEPEHGLPGISTLERQGWRRVAPHRWYSDTWLMRSPLRAGDSALEPAPAGLLQRDSPEMALEDLGVSLTPIDLPVPNVPRRSGLLERLLTLARRLARRRNP